jgi:hypothetical protein
VDALLPVLPYDLSNLPLGASAGFSVYFSFVAGSLHA